MATRVLIINKQLVFAVTLKQALEQTGAYEVHPFTAADPAIEYVQENPQDVAIVDFTLPGITGPILVQRLRAAQPDLLIIASPRPAEATEVMRALRLQGMINVPFTVRDIIPVIEQALEDRQQDEALFGDATTQPAEPIGAPDFGQTRRFDDEAFETTPSKTKLPDDQPPVEEYGTRILDDEQPSSTEDWQTRIFDDLGASVGGETPQFRRPASVPEISNLDSVLANLSDSSLFEPPTKESDTPAVPTKDSDALRQFLATAGDFTKDAGFDDILEAIDSAKAGAQDQRKPSDFDNLVESLRGSDSHTALPDRQQQFMDFILTSGMDAVLQEIEKVKTGTMRKFTEPSPEQELSSTFQKLSEEEPPLPTLEESGTIGDLMIGVSEKSFRNVLAVLRGEDASEPIDPLQTPIISEQERAESLARFYEPVTDTEMPQASTPPEMPSFQPAESRAGFAFDEEDVIEEEPGDSTLAQIILETTLDQNTLGFSLDEVMSNIEGRLSVYRPDVQPLPSWGPAFERRKREEEKLIREPDFLPEELPPPNELPADLTELEITDRLNIETTKPSSRQVIESHPEDIETDQFAQAPQSRQVAGDTPTGLPEWALEEAGDFTPLPLDEAPVAESLEEAPADDFALAQDAWTEEGAETVIAEAWTLEHGPTPEAWEVESLPIESTEEAAIAETVQGAMPGEAVEAQWPAAVEPEAAPVAEAQQPATEDARIAQLALNLTQASLELTAEATLLTSEGELVASAGHLAAEDADEIGHIIANDWDAHAEGARVRYITLPSSGRDYMLYSLKTDEGFTLSLIFAGTTPLRVIRRQGQRLAEALQSVPEAPVIEEAPPPVIEEEAPARGEIRRPPEVKVMTAYTFVWLLRDPNLQLSQSIAQAVHAGLSIQLAELGWRIKALQASGDHVYLLADVPGDTPAQELIRDLQHRSAEIVRTQDRSLDPASLWADSYFILTPGRELEMDEIAEFINFERT